MRLRLDPPIPLETPKGYGLAHFIDDYGIDHEDYWGVCLTETGEWWWFKNSEVRGCENKTLGRIKKKPIAYFRGIPIYKMSDIPDIGYEG